MKVKLMNSAMMPQEGVYITEEITKGTFIRKLMAASEMGTLDSFIGYPQNAQLIQAWSGVEVAVNLAETTLQDGDTMLVMKLKYRTRSKGEPVGEDDFRFFFVEYYEFKKE